jgi:ComF family protein
VLGTDSPVYHEVADRFRARGSIDALSSCYLFEKDASLQTVLHLLKYSGMASLGVRLGRDIGERIRTDPLFRDATALVPVPLHRFKRRERGYNQAELLCRGITETTGIPGAASLIVRKRHTISQTHLSLEERTDNVRGAFSAAAGAVSQKGAVIILVDDVITTGSTILECAEVLRGMGAERVLAASAALAR